MCSPEQPCSCILRTAGGVDINLGNIMGLPESNRPDELWIVFVDTKYDIRSLAKIVHWKSLKGRRR